MFIETVLDNPANRMMLLSSARTSTKFGQKDTPKGLCWHQLIRWLLPFRKFHPVLFPVFHSYHTTWEWNTQNFCCKFCPGSISKRCFTLSHAFIPCQWPRSSKFASATEPAFFFFLWQSFWHLPQKGMCQILMMFVTLKIQTSFAMTSC